MYPSSLSGVSCSLFADGRRERRRRRGGLRRAQLSRAALGGVPGSMT